MNKKQWSSEMFTTNIRIKKNQLNNYSLQFLSDVCGEYGCTDLLLLNHHHTELLQRWYYTRNTFVTMVSAIIGSTII